MKPVKQNTRLLYELLLRRQIVSDFDLRTFLIRLTINFDIYHWLHHQSHQIYDGHITCFGFASQNIWWYHATFGEHQQGLSNGNDLLIGFAASTDFMCCFAFLVQHVPVQYNYKNYLFCDMPNLYTSQHSVTCLIYIHHNIL